MGWQTAAGLNLVIAACYVAISTLVALGLVRTRQVSSNPLAVATSAIFLSCAVHHGHHAAHLLAAFGGPGHAADLASVRAVFGEWHTIAVDTVGAVVAIVYLGLRRNYRTLLSTPRMFEDRVRLAAEEALRDLAFTDSLTGIPNRAAYQELADACADDDRQAVVVFLDLDGFKGINDRFGHDTGDRLLRDVAQGVAASLARGEHVFRMGGDELVVVGLPDGDSAPDDLLARVERAVTRPVDAREGVLVVEASCGTASGPASTMGALLREADQAMYRIKAGRAAVPVPRTAALLPE